MPIRVGTDLVSVAEVRAALETHADRYLQRVYTVGEQRDCLRLGSPDPERLAARFAAKEATMKILRSSSSVPWTSIEVLRHDDGAPAIRLHGHAAQAAEAAGVCELAVSLTHESGLASAVVIAETRRID